MKFTSSERQMIKEVSTEILGRIAYKPDLFVLIKKWAYAAKEVSLGYRESLIYEYVNDLDIRDSIEEVIRELDTSLQKKIREYVEQYDDVFFANTIELKKPFVAGKKSPWWRRLPKKPSASFKKDAKEIYKVEYEFD